MSKGATTLAALLMLVGGAARAQQAQLQYPDIVGAAQRGYAQGQAQRMREIEIQQAQQALQQQRANEAQEQKDQQDQQELRRLTGVLLAAQTDDERWAAVNQMAAIDPTLAVQYMEALHLNQPKH